MPVLFDPNIRVATIATLTHAEMLTISGEGKLPKGIPVYIIDKGIVMVSDGETRLDLLYAAHVAKLKSTLGI